MGIEIRKGRTYWYDRKRVNGRMHCTYYGAIPAEGIELFRLQAEMDLENREQARHEVEQTAKWADDVLAAGEEFDRLADGVFREVMHLTGHTLHKRSEWRRTRGVTAMAKPEEISTVEKPSDWIGVAELAAASLVLMATKNPKGIAEGIEAHFDYIKKLLADYPQPTFAERMAATRAAINWLSVNILESKAALQTGVASANALMIDKRITLAEKRLHASLRSLAVLRRLRKSAAPKQVNVANGPMVVNNGK